MKKKVIVFDLDGVLFDSIGLMSEYRKRAYPTLTDADIKELHTGNIFEEAKKRGHVPIESTAEQNETIRKEYLEKKLSTPLYDGIKELVENLSQKHVLAVNTSADNKSSVPLLENARIDEHFSLVATRDLHPSKVEKFKLIGQTFETEPSEMLFITDTLGDLYEARELAIPTIAVTWGVHDRSFFERETHPHLVGIAEHTNHLSELIEKHI